MKLGGYITTGLVAVVAVVLVFRFIKPVRTFALAQTT
jgi:hypothetical protein